MKVFIVYTCAAVVFAAVSIAANSAPDFNSKIAAAAEPAKIHKGLAIQD